ncbi:aminotransferase class V-fold PLP-dependent enzyme [Candidatus Nitrospira salsa]|nr:MAG: class V aminotransferase [Nitrospirales bacterium]
MSGRKLETNNIQHALAALGSGPLEEHTLLTHIHPLFSEVLRRQETYLANHSLGRPLDQTKTDIQQALNHWYADMDNAWDDWLAEIQHFRHSIAQLIRAPSTDCIVPKTSAGQGLRAVLNCFDQKYNVITTTAEFSSIDHILKVYAQRDRIALQHVKPDDQGIYHEEDMAASVKHANSLVVISMVLFSTGQYFTNLAEMIREMQARGAMVLIDLYHAAGALPVNIELLGADFAIGGCYKYLRGGPGACWLYIHPQHLTGSLTTLDTGWFAQPSPFEFRRPEEAKLAQGGNAFLESTPAVLPYYQAKAGLALTLGLGVERLRAYSLKQQARLTDLLHKHGIHVLGKPETRGAFLTIRHQSANSIASKLKNAKITIDARENLLRICPDILNTDQEFVTSVSQFGTIMGRNQ